MKARRKKQDLRGTPAGRFNWLLYDSLVRTDRQLAARRKGGRCVEDVEVLLHESKWYSQVRDTEMALSLPCKFGSTFGGGNSFSRQSLDEEALCHPAEDGTPALESFPFYGAGKPAHDHDKHLRQPAWSWGRVFLFWVLTIIFMVLFAGVGPVIIFFYYVVNYMERKRNHRKKPSRVLISAIPASFLMCKISAHRVASPREAPSNRKLQNLPFLIIMMIPPLTSLIIIGMPVFLFVASIQLFPEIDYLLTPKFGADTSLSRNGTIFLALAMFFWPVSLPVAIGILIHRSLRKT